MCQSIGNDRAAIEAASKEDLLECWANSLEQDRMQTSSGGNAITNHTIKCFLPIYAEDVEQLSRMYQNDSNQLAARMAISKAYMLRCWANSIGNHNMQTYSNDGTITSILSYMFRNSAADKELLSELCRNNNNKRVAGLAKSTAGVLKCWADREDQRYGNNM